MLELFELSPLIWFSFYPYTYLIYFTVIKTVVINKDLSQPLRAKGVRIKPGFHNTANATTTTQKQSDYRVEQPGFHYTANATTTTQKQSDYRVEQSSFTLIALF